MQARPLRGFAAYAGSAAGWRWRVFSTMCRQSGQPALAQAVKHMDTAADARCTAYANFFQPGSPIMFKKFLAFLATMSLITAFAAVDVNKATDAELDGVKGIGPVTTQLIVTERKKGDFKSWQDFIGRVKGIGDRSASKLSANGLTVGGAAYTGPGAAEAKANAKKTDKTVGEKTKEVVKDAVIGTKETVKEVAKDVKTAVTPKPTATPPTSSASAAKK